MRFDTLANIREILKFLTTYRRFFHLAEPRPLPATCSKMQVVALCLSISLLFCGVVGLQDGNRARDKAPLASRVLCPSHPYPVLDPSTMQQILAPFLEEVGNKMSTELKTTPGGAVVSLVYRDTIIWTYGYGAINMSG